MACGTCNKVVDLADGGIDYRLREGVVSIQANNGTSLRITESAVARPHQPRQGWQVTLTINGQRMVVPGKSPVEVRNAAEHLLVQNGVKVSVRDLWFNLNIQWLRRTPEKHRMVDLNRYLSYAEPQDRVVSDKHSRGVWNASEWLDLALWFIGIYLSSESYNRVHFESMAESLLETCDPAVSPITGSSKVFIPLSARVSSLVKRPAFTRDEARDWFVSTLQTLPLNNAPVPATMESVATKYHWTL